MFASGFTILFSVIIHRLKAVVRFFGSYLKVFVTVVVGLSLVIHIVWTHVAVAAVPRILSYQLRLTDANGIPVADGTQNIKISIYDAASAGSRLATDCGTTGTPVARKAVFTNGVASILIGDTAADSSHNCADGSAPNAISATLFDNETLYLGITVSSDSEMTPRKRIVAGGFALNSDKLDNLDSSSSGGTTAFVPVTDSSGLLTLTGNPTTTAAVITANSAAGANELLIDLQTSSTTVFKVDAEGDTTISGDLVFASGATFNVGGSGSDVAFSAIGDSLAGAANVNSDNDLYIEDDLEVDGTIFGTINSGFTTGSVPFQGASGLTQDNANFFFDDSANRLSIGEHTVSQSATRLQIDDATNSAAALELFTIRRSRADATAPVADFGSDIGFRLENGTDGGDVEAARIRAAWAAAPASQQVGYLTFAVTSDPSGGSPTLTEVMRITAQPSATASQNPLRVGINATSPRGAFDIVGDSNSSGQNTVYISNDGTGSHGNVIFTSASNGANRVAIGNSNSAATGNRSLQNHPYLWFNSSNDLMISTSSSNPVSDTSTNIADFTSFGLEMVNTAVLGIGSGAFNTPFGGFGRYENGLTFSEQFNDAAWSISGGNISTTNSATAAPDGSTTAEVATSTATMTLSQSATAYTASGNTYTGSIWMRISGSTTPQTITLRIDCGATTGTGSDKIVNGSTWQRFYVTQTCGAVAGSPSFLIIGPVLTGFDLLVWGAQLEEQSTPGVYIQTTSSAITTTQRGSLTAMGNLTSTNAAQIIAPSLTTGTGLAVSTTALTSGTGISVTGGTALTTNGELILADMGAATAGNGVVVTTTGVYTGTGLLSVTANSATTGVVSAISVTGLTSGTGLRITGGSSLSSGGELFQVTSSITTAAAGQFITGGTYTGNGFVDISAAAATSGTVLNLRMDALTSGTGISFDLGSSLTTNGELIDANMGAATAGNGIVLTTTGVYTGTGIVSIVADSATSGDAIDISMNALTSGHAIDITAGNITNGVLVRGSISNTSASTAFTGFGFSLSDLRTYTSDPGANHSGVIGNFSESVTANAASFTSAYDGDNVKIASSFTVSNADDTDGFDITGNVIDVSRSLTASAGEKLEVTGAVATFSDSALSGAGTLTSTSDVMQISQFSTANSGAALNVTTSGGASSFGLRVNDDGTLTDSTPFIVDSSGNVAIGTTSAGANFDIESASTTSKVMLITADSLTQSNVIDISANAAQTTVLLRINSSNASATTEFGGSMISSSLSRTYTSNPGGNLSGSLVNLISSQTANAAAFAVDSDGDLFRISASYTATNADDTDGFDVTASVMDITRTPSASGTEILNISGALASFADGNSGDAGFESSADVLNVIQNASVNTGAAVNITTAGGASAFGLRVNDDGSLTDSTAFVVDSSGNVGVLTTTPGQELEVNGDIRLDFNGTATTNGVCHSGANSDTTATDRDLVVCSASPNDIAEWYETTEGVEPAEIVVATDETLTYEADRVNPLTGEIDLVNKDILTATVLTESTSANQARILGIVSTSPVQTYGRGVIKVAQHPQPIAITGRVPLKVSAVNGEIKPGDAITSSDIPGVGMKATGAGMIVGFALDGWSSEEVGQILVYVHTGWYDGRDTNTDVSGLAIHETTTVTDFSLAHESLSVLALVSSAGKWSINEEGLLVAKELVTDKVTTGEIAVLQNEEKQSVGESVILAGTNSLVVDNALVNTKSRIFITLYSDYDGSWWISARENGKFKISLSKVAPHDIAFEYLIVSVVDRRAEVLEPEDDYISINEANRLDTTPPQEPESVPEQVGEVAGAADEEVDEKSEEPVEEEPVVEEVVPEVVQEPEKAPEIIEPEPVPNIEEAPAEPEKAPEEAPTVSEPEPTKE